MAVDLEETDRVAALQLVTLAPAQQLGISERVGSIEEGKDADLVLLNGDPFSSLSRVEWTMVDGVLEFERRDAFGLGFVCAEGGFCEAGASEPRCARTWPSPAQSTSAARYRRSEG